MAQQGIVKVINQIGRRVRAVVYCESPDASDRLDLLVPIIDSQTSKVTWYSRPKCAHRIDYVLLDEDDSALGSGETAHLNRGTDTGEVTQDVSTGQESSPQAVPEPAAAQPAQETWQRLGFASRADWKQAGKPEA